MKQLRKKKKIIIFIVSLFIIFGLIIGINAGNSYRVSEIEKHADEWKNAAIIAPEAGALEAAGHITISWKPADSLGTIKEYEIYVDDELVATVDGNTTTYEYYDTEVVKHQLYIKAKLSLGSEINSDITTFFVNKKGLCVNMKMAYPLNALEWGTSWYYNWSVQESKLDSFQDMEFIPMIWSRSSTDEKTISRFSKFGYKHVLAYNEPDLVGQANMEIEDAVEGMSDFMDQNLIVGSPASALCPPWSDDWFQPFMEQLTAKGMDVDFIAVHHYWNWYTEEGAYEFLKLIDETWEMYGKPIWITEFAITGVPGRTDEELKIVYDYMNIVIPELDKREYVERYAWFPFSYMDYKNAGSALYQYYTGEVYELGHLYQELGMPEGYDVNNKVENIDNPIKDVIK